MALPQINEKQLALLISMVEGLGAFSSVVPDPKLDSAESYTIMMEELCDTQQLVIMGLLKEITDDKEVKEKLVNMYSMTGRLFRIFQITDVGVKMFSKDCRAIN
jgi:hypothetical protein